MVTERNTVNPIANVKGNKEEMCKIRLDNLESVKKILVAREKFKKLQELKRREQVKQEQNDDILDELEDVMAKTTTVVY